jgi:hypothetical protein
MSPKTAVRLLLTSVFPQSPVKAMITSRMYYERRTKLLHVPVRFLQEISATAIFDSKFRWQYITGFERLRDGRQYSFCKQAALTLSSTVQPAYWATPLELTNSVTSAASWCTSSPVSGLLSSHRKIQGPSVLCNTARAVIKDLLLPQALSQYVQLSMVRKLARTKKRKTKRCTTYNATGCCAYSSLILLRCGLIGGL